MCSCFCANSIATAQHQCEILFKDHAGILLFPLELKNSKLPFSEVSKTPTEYGTNSQMNCRTNLLAKHKPVSSPLAVQAHWITLLTPTKQLSLNTFYFWTVTNTPRHDLQKVPKADKVISKHGKLSVKVFVWF